MNMVSRIHYTLKVDYRTCPSDAAQCGSFLPLRQTDRNLCSAKSGFTTRALVFLAVQHALPPEGSRESNSKSSLINKHVILCYESWCYAQKPWRP